jgi:MFS family permease
MVGLLTYAGEYISSLVILAWIQDKLVIQFKFATYATYTASTWAYVGDISRVQNMGKSYGLLEIAEYGGFAFGPGVGIYVSRVWGREPTFAFSATLVLSAAVAAALLMREMPRDAASENGPTPTVEVEATRNGLDGEASSRC